MKKKLIALLGILASVYFYYSYYSYYSIGTPEETGQSCETLEERFPGKYEIVFPSGDNKIGCAVQMTRAEGGKMAYVDTEGNMLVEAFPFDNGPDYFKAGLSRFLENGKVGFMNTDLKKVIPAQFDGAGSFDEDRLTVQVCIGCKVIRDTGTSEYSSWEGGKSGLMNTRGEIKWGEPKI
ncbi:WG repeat-containing protein [Candidatus Peregrinibacteria bacterium]|nr:WG repeat-containing protein [Candidatus Peregrinibacteria bacterium]